MKTDFNFLKSKTLCLFLFLCQVASPTIYLSNQGLNPASFARGNVGYTVYAVKSPDLSCSTIFPSGEFSMPWSESLPMPLGGLPSEESPILRTPPPDEYEEWDNQREMVPVGDIPLLLFVFLTCMYGLYARKQLSTKNNSSLKSNRMKSFILQLLFKKQALCTVLFLSLGISSFAQSDANVTIEPGSNPAVIVPNGEPVVFSVTVKNSGAATYNGAELAFTIPSNYTYNTVSSPTASVTKVSGQNRIRFNLSGGNASVTVNITLDPLCVTSDSEVISYALYNGMSTSNPIATGITPLISNLKKPSLEFTAPVTPSTALKWWEQGITQTWTLEQKAAQSYVRAEKLAIQFSTDKILDITSLTIKYGSLTRIIPSSQIIRVGSGNYFTYTYTITKGDFQAIGLADGLLNAAQKIEFIEMISIDCCTGGYLGQTSSTRNYTINYGCGTEITNKQVVIPLERMNIYLLSTINSLQWPVAPGTKGTLDFSVNNASLEEYFQAKDFHFTIFNETNKLKVTSMKLLAYNNVSYNIDVTSLLVASASGTWFPTYLDVSNISQIGHSLLEKGKSCRFLLEFECELQPAGNCPVQLLLPGDNVIETRVRNQCSGSTEDPYLIPMAEVWFGSISLGFNPNINAIVEPLMVHVTDNVDNYAVLTISENGGQDGEKNQNYLTGATYNHRTIITLPDGMTYDNGDASCWVKVNMSGSGSVTIPASNLSYNTTTKELAIKLGGGIDASTGIVYEIKVKGVDETIDSKKMLLRHSLDTDGVGPDANTIYYACTEKNLSYETDRKDVCTLIETRDFVVERTTFGYLNEQMSALAGKTTSGVNLKAAGPYDNVEIRVDAIFGSGVSYQGLQAGDKLITEISYLGTEKILDVVNPVAAVLQYCPPGGEFGAKYNIPLNSKIESETGYIKVDLTDYVGIGKAIPALAAGAQIRLLINAQVTENLPALPQNINEFSAHVYRRVSERVYSCSKRMNNFTVWNYKLRKLGESSPAVVINSRVFNQYRDKDSRSLLRLSLNNEANGQSEIFTNEYRPNGIIKKGTIIRIDGLYKVDELITATSPVNAGDNYAKLKSLVKDVDYMVEYRDCKSYVTLLKDIISNELFSNTNDFFEIRAELTYVPVIFSSWTSAKDIHVSADAGTGSVLQNYPTSAVPNILSDITEGQAKLHSIISKYDVSTSVIVDSPASSLSPDTKSLDFKLKIINNVPLTGSILPNVWIAVVLESGDMTNLELWDGSGATRIGSLIPYADRSYWIKLGDLVFESGFKEFKIRGQYTCTTTLVPAFYVGYSQVTYPDDPSTGWFTSYNSGMCLGLPVAQRVLFTVPQASYTPTLINPQYASTGDGGRYYYNFCKPMTFKVTFNNNTETKLGSLKLDIKRIDGLNMVESSGITIQKGNNTPVTLPISMLKTTSTYYTISIPEEYYIDSYQTGDTNPDAKLSVTFQMKTACGFTPGQPVRIETSAKDPCGNETSNSVTSNSILLEELKNNTQPQVEIVDLKLNGSTNTSVAYASVTDNGILELTGTIKCTGNPVTGMKVYIDIPKNMEIVSSADNYLKKENTVISSFIKNEYVVNDRLSANLDLNQSSSVPVTYTFKVSLKCINPEEWDCLPNAIVLGCAVVSILNCDGSDCEIFNPTEGVKSGTFTLNKIDLSMDADKISLTGRFNSATTETVTVSGYITNDSPVMAYKVEIDLYAGETQLPSYISIPSIPGNSGVSFTQDFQVNVADICFLKLVLPKKPRINPYICNAIEIVKPVEYELANNLYNECEGNGVNLLIGDEALVNYTYQWVGSYLSGMDQAQASYTFPKGNSLKDENQIQEKYLYITRSGGCMVKDTVTVRIAPNASTWEGNDTNIANVREWNSVYNWSNGIPAKCTDVLIPGGLTDYPVLQDPVQIYECNKITFMHGGQLAKPFQLDYEEAEVHLTIREGKWIKLAPPLRNVYSGDYFESSIDPMLTSRPRVYTMLYQTVNPQKEAQGKPYEVNSGKWSMPFATADVELLLGTGMVVWLDLPQAGANGNFKFPSPYTKYPYFDKQDGVTPLGVYTKDLDRTYSHRFIYEEKANQMPDNGLIKNRYSGFFSLPVTCGITKTDETTALVANPFMSYLDINSFLTQNSGKLETSYYYMWTGTAFNPVISGENIAPMQSFVIAKKTSCPNFSTLEITPAMSIHKKTSDTGLRSAASATGQMQINVLRDGDVHSSVVLFYDENTTAEDIPTLFNAVEKKPAVLFAMNDGKAMSVRYLKDFSQQVELGIRTTVTGLLSFRISQMENFLPGYDVYLEDVENHISYNLREQVEIPFNNTTGDVVGRFYLRVSKQSTDMDNLQQLYEIFVREETGKINVSCSENDLLKSIEILNMQGMSLYRHPAVNSSVHDIYMNKTAGQLLIVKVISEKAQKTVKMLLLK